MWPLSVTRVWVQPLSVPWKLMKDGFSVCCILYPCILQLSICYIQQTLGGIKLGVWERNQEIFKCLNIKAKHEWKKSILHTHIPPDHNIHSLVLWCTGTGQSVSATRRWSDYSFLNCQEIMITYQHTCIHTHPCTLFMSCTSFWEKYK